LLPFPRNELFTGREDQLQSLEKFLLPLNTHRRITICGLGGCGKSALALEFAYRALARQSRQLIFWVPAISQESFELAYREIGIYLRIPGITDNNTDVKGLVKKVLSSETVDQWLMVVDNADDPGVLLGSTDGDPVSARLLDCLPHSNRGKILFTTRSRRVAGDLTQSRIIELHDMSKAEARQLLARRISKPELLDDGKAVDILLESLTYLPLAIVQAAAFVNSNDVSVSGYLSLFRRAGNEIELFGEHFEDPSRYRGMESTITKTWHISFDQIRRQEPLAAEYLSFIACIDRINIPQSMLPPSGSLVQQAKAIGMLKGYAFITERQQALQDLENEKLFDMHRLVHMASKWWLKVHNEQTAWTVKVADRLEKLIPYGGHEKKEVWTMYLSHALHVAGIDSQLEVTTRASLLDRVGLCQLSLGQYSTAESTHRQIVLLSETNIGKDHPSTLTRMGNLALALYRQGKYKEAESMNRQTLAQREKVLGPEDRNTLTNMDHLALVLKSQGRYEEAEMINRQALAQFEKILGAEHPDTLISMNILAVVLESQGKYEEAESIIRQTLAQREKVLGAEHPDTLKSMDNLALVLYRQGKYEEAESMDRQTLAQREKVLGAEHPDTLKSMDNLALVLACRGKYEEAILINRQSLAQFEKILGAEHPDTLMSMYCLAHLLARGRRTDESIVLYERAYTGYSAVLGENHPFTRACRKHSSELLISSEKDQRTILPETPDYDESIHTGRISKLPRGLAKLGARSSMSLDQNKVNLQDVT
jgi:tetratricopeptide (TPR) repeat protein